MARYLFCPIGGRDGRGKFRAEKKGSPRGRDAGGLPAGAVSPGENPRDYFFPRLFRPSASFAARPFSWAIFFFASEYFRATRGVFVGTPNCLR